MNTQQIFDRITMQALGNLFAKLGDSAIIDHIGYKCTFHHEYKHARNMFMNTQKTIGMWCYESYISDRKITYVRLIPEFADRLEIRKGMNINYIEIQDQKIDQSQVSGTDHVEILPNNISESELITIVEGLGYIVTQTGKDHHITFDFSIPRAGNKNLIIKIAKEPLLEKIKREEMK